MVKGRRNVKATLAHIQIISNSHQDQFFTPRPARNISLLTYLQHFCIKVNFLDTTDPPFVAASELIWAVLKMIFEHYIKYFKIICKKVFYGNKNRYLIALAAIVWRLRPLGHDGYT